MKRLTLTLLAITAITLTLGGCREVASSREARKVYQAPRTAAEAARSWRGRKIDVLDQHGDQIARLRTRKYGLQVFDADLTPLGQVREVGEVVVVERRDGSPRFTFVPARIPAAPSDADPPTEAPREVDGYAIHKVDAGKAPGAPVDGEPAPRKPDLPPSGALIGYLLPDPQRQGGWRLLDQDRIPALLISPEPKAPAKNEEADKDAAGKDTAGKDTADKDTADKDTADKDAADKDAASDGPWRVTFMSPEQTGSTTWVIERKRHRGQPGVEAHRIDAEGGRFLALRTRGGKLSALATAPALLTRLDPLMRAGLIQVLTRAEAERRPRP